MLSEGLWHSMSWQIQVCQWILVWEREFCSARLFFPTNVPDDQKWLQAYQQTFGCRAKDMTDLQILYHKIKLGNLSSAGGHSLTNCLVVILKIKTPSFRFSTPSCFLKWVSSNSYNKSIIPNFVVDLVPWLNSNFYNYWF